MPIQNSKSENETQRVAPKGGSFLIEARSPEDVFTPEDMTDQHKLIAQTVGSSSRKRLCRARWRWKTRSRD